MAAIAMANAGCTVTVLEAAAQLGEIGAGIQMVTQASLESTSSLTRGRRRMSQSSSYAMALTKPLAEILCDSKSSISGEKMAQKSDTLS